MKLLSSDPVSDTVCLLTDESLTASSHLNESMTATEGSKIPFERATGLPFFEYHKTVRLTVLFHSRPIITSALQPEGKAKGDRFPRAMVGWGNVTGKGLLATVYPWEQQPADTTICDVAGGNGHVTMGLMKAHPHLKVVLQDQEQVIVMGKQFWNQEYSEAVERGRVEFVPFNFFQDTAATGCDFYYVRYTYLCWSLLMLNWTPLIDPFHFARLARRTESFNPQQCPEGYEAFKQAYYPCVLCSIRRLFLMCLLIDDTVLRQAVRTTSPSPSQKDATFQDVAPEPLLPNYGAARIRTYELDMIMMNLLGSAARTLDEFLSLCGTCGLKFEKLYEAGETDLIEFSPV